MTPSLPPVGVDPDSGLAFQSVIFGRGRVEISFTEEHDRSAPVARIQTLLLDPEKVLPEYANLIDALTQLTQGALVALRNPPDVLER